MFGSAMPCLLFCIALSAIQKSMGMGITEDDKTLIVESHNRLRGMAALTHNAANMEKISWDAELVKSAAEYAQECTWDKSKPSSRNGAGELIASNGQAGVENVMEWFSKNKECMSLNGTSDKMRKCGKFHQMIWASTNKIGCAHHECESVRSNDADIQEAINHHKHIYVCHYMPSAGIVEDEATAKLVYMKGEACSKCPPHASKCENGLCVH